MIIKLWTQALGGRRAQTGAAASPAHTDRLKGAFTRVPLPFRSGK